MLPERASKWYVPEEHVVTHLLDIQTEELAATLAADEAAAAAAVSAALAGPGPEHAEGVSEHGGGSRARRKPRRDGDAANGPPRRKRRPRTAGGDVSVADSGAGSRDALRQASRQAHADKPAGGSAGGEAGQKLPKHRRRSQRQPSNRHDQSPAPVSAASAHHQNTAGQRTAAVTVTHISEPTPEGLRARHEQHRGSVDRTSPGGEALICQ